jgi:pilus assembly protein Flp/PilA
MIKIHFAKAVQAFYADEQGASAIEYAMVAGAMALAIVPLMNLIDTALAGKFTDIAGYFSLYF